jgi:hypothetical protein
VETRLGKNISRSDARKSILGSDARKKIRGSEAEFVEK